MPSALHRLLALAALAWLPGCLSASPHASTFASEPSGARVWIDGRDSGWVTPCQIALDEDATHLVSLELEGFAPYQIELQPSTRHHIVDWQLGASGAQSTITFPLFLPPSDLLLPFRRNRALHPVRVFAHLWPKEDS